MKPKLNQLLILLTCILSLPVAGSPAARAAKTGFNGTWKGEIQLPTFGGRGARGQTPQAGQQLAQRGGGDSGFGGGGFGGRGGGGGFPAGAPNARNSGGPQKVILRVSTKNNDTKAVGNITVGETTMDIKDGKIDGDTITFKAGAVGGPVVYEYMGTRDGDQIMMTQTFAGNAQAQPIHFTMKRS